jgi:hypothetical protein
MSEKCTELSISSDAWEDRNETTTSAEIVLRVDGGSLFWTRSDPTHLNRDPTRPIDKGDILDPTRPEPVRTRKLPGQLY